MHLYIPIWVYIRIYIYIFVHHFTLDGSEAPTRGPADAHFGRDLWVGNVDLGGDGVGVVDAEGVQHGQLPRLRHQQRVGKLSAGQVPHQAGVVGVEFVNDVPRTQDLRDAMLSQTGIPIAMWHGRVSHSVSSPPQSADIWLCVRDCVKVDIEEFCTYSLCACFLFLLRSSRRRCE